MTETTLSWSATNWITVLLMVVAGYAVMGLASQAFLRATAGSAAAAPAA